TDRWIQAQKPPLMPSVSVAVLLSVVSPGGVPTVATSTRLCEPLSKMPETVTVKVTEPPAGIVTEVAIEPVPEVAPTLAPAATVAVQLIEATFAGMASVNACAGAAAGPAFVTTMV